MPLLHKQKFVPIPIPKDLEPDQEVFFSKQTREIFTDYDEYFERTILCNSLVWTCCLTGKQNLTFGEALASEKKALKQIASFPSSLYKPLIYLISLTKRGNIKDLVDDVFSFSKDRYFIGETVLLNKEQTKADSQKTLKIIEINLPDDVKKKSQDESLMESDEVGSSQKANPDKIKYLIEIESKLNGSTTTQTMRGNQIKRPLNTLTKDKISMIARSCCETVDSNWQLTEKSRRKFDLNNVKFTEFFKGEPPQFDVTYGRGQFAKVNKSITKAKSPPAKPVKNSPKTKNSSTPSTKAVVSTPKGTPSKDTEKVSQSKIKQILNKKIKDMTDDEYLIWRSHKAEDDLKDIDQIEIEYEKNRKREEQVKEKERIKQEKLKEKLQLAESKKPKEDFEAEDLKPIPHPLPIQSKLSQEMLGDAIIILEFLNNFGDLFDLADDFPNGFNLDLLENALFSKSCDSALCNLLLFFLDSCFKCFDEETFENEVEEDEINDDEIPLTNDSDNEDQIGLEQLYNMSSKHDNDSRETFVDLAESFSQLVKTIQGRSVKNIGLDVYTITEMLRLYFLTCGSDHYSKVKFWYQQRGGYTRMDEVGIDFALNEKAILKRMESLLVYELEADEKLKILTSLCHQLISHVRFRDYTEDNLNKVTLARAQLRELQTEENKRTRDEASAQWKMKNEERIKEKEVKAEGGENAANALEAVRLAHEAQMAKMQAESNHKRDLFLKKERSIKHEIYDLMYKCSMYPIGKDRYYRRYWAFKSLPGLFVEDCNEDWQLGDLLEGYLDRLPETINGGEAKAESQNQVDGVQVNENCQVTINGKEGKSQLSDLTNLSNNNNNNGCNNITNGVINGQAIVKMDTNEDSGSEEKSAVLKVEGEVCIKPQIIKKQQRWCFFNTVEDINKLIDSLNERGIRESELKHNLIDLKDDICDNLNKKSHTIKNLTLTEEDIKKSLKICLKENINSVLASHLFYNPKQNKRQATKAAANLAFNNFAKYTARKYIELDLRDKLADFEEQIFIGSLGNLKNAERNRWKDSVIPTDKQTSQEDEAETEAETRAKVNVLCQALLQLEQSVEKRFLRTPLGEAQNTPSKKRSKPTVVANTPDKTAQDDDKYQILINWEKSLMHCTNYSQIFVHLQSLDESIAWSKSAMNARCRICRKKGDAEKMLLCDKCDNGHHMYCLRPQLKDIPDGQWFCPDCKPKDVERTPRKIRDTFKEEEENDEAEKTMASDENSEESNEEEDDETAVEETEAEEEEEMETGIETQESTAEEDMNDSDYAINGKVKLKGFNIGRKKKATLVMTDEDMAEESIDELETSKGRRGRKRRATGDEKRVTPKNGRLKGKFDSAEEDIGVVSLSGRLVRGRKPVYAEVSEAEDDGLTETDEEMIGRKKKKNKKIDTDTAEEDCYVANTNSRNTDVGQRLKVVEKLLNSLIKHEDAWPFLKPVSKREAADYYDVIKRPMDFSTIKNNINNFKYDDYTSIIEDIRLVFENCRQYNEPDSEIYEVCERVSSYFEKEAKKAGLLDTKQLATAKK